MGMSASQARLLTLTARIHDVENEAQRIQNQKLLLANQSDEAYDDYLDAINSKFVQNQIFNPETGEFNFTDSNFGGLVDAGFGFKVKQGATGEWTDCYNYAEVSETLGISPQVADSRELLSGLINEGAVVICNKTRTASEAAVCSQFIYTEGAPSVAISNETEYINIPETISHKYTSTVYSLPDSSTILPTILANPTIDIVPQQFNNYRISYLYNILDYSLLTFSNTNPNGMSYTVDTVHTQNKRVSDLNEVLREAKLELVLLSINGTNTACLRSTVPGTYNIATSMCLCDSPIQGCDYALEPDEELIGNTNYQIPNSIAHQAANFQAGETIEVNLTSSQGGIETYTYTLRNGDTLNSVIEGLNELVNEGAFTIQEGDDNSTLRVNWEPSEGGISDISFGGTSILATILGNEFEASEVVEYPGINDWEINIGQLVGNNAYGTPITENTFTITIGDITKTFNIVNDENYKFEDLIAKINNDSDLDVTASLIENGKLQIKTNNDSNQEIIFGGESNFATVSGLTCTTGALPQEGWALNGSSVIVGNTDDFLEEITAGTIYMTHDGVTYEFNLTPELTINALNTQINELTGGKIKGRLEDGKYYIESTDGKSIDFSSDGSNFFDVLGYSSIYELKPTMVAVDIALRERSDDSQLAEAEAAYEAALRRIDRKDRKYDTDLAAIDSQRSALTTELDTLKTCTKENVERTFKLFS